jgi:hypothetical protein
VPDAQVPVLATADALFTICSLYIESSPSEASTVSRILLQPPEAAKAWLLPVVDPTKPSRS